MQRLSGTDAMFLAIELPAWHQHVGGLTILDRSDAPELDFLALRDLLAERLPLAPRFRWRLKEVPLGLDRPVWVDDDEFDIDHHLHHVALPAPGGLDELIELTGRILSRQLDRHRPLWEMWFVEGLPNQRVATIMKYHHCMLDGVAGAGLAELLIDFAPDAPPPDVPHESDIEHPGREPSDLELIARSAPSLATVPFRAVGYLGRAARRGLTMFSMARQGHGVLPTDAPPTRFNGPVGRRRRLSFCSLALDDVKAVKRHYGVTVNDVVLAVVAGALRRYLLGHDDLPEQPLLTIVPVSTRSDDDDGSSGNRLANMVVGLATDLDDPAERLRAIHESAVGAKEMTAAIRSTPIPSLGETAPPVVFDFSLGAMDSLGLLSMMPAMVNTVVSNVQGPAFPLYCCGAAVTGIFPTSIIMEGMGLNVTLFSYMDRLDFGLFVDPDLVPDAPAITDAFPAALAELMEAAGLGSPSEIEDPLGYSRAPAGDRAG